MFIYETVRSALSLDKFWDYYSTVFSSVLLRNYDNIISIVDYAKMFNYEDWVIIGPLVKKKIIELINRNKESLGVVVADSALDKAISFGINKIDVFVTDLDGLDPIYPKIHYLMKLVDVVSIHFHGDNINNAWEVVELLKFYRKKVLPTCQVGFGKRVFNVGGFTDGDRATILAIIAGAKRLWLSGMDFEGYPRPNSIAKPIDFRSYYKLKIARYVIESLSNIYKVLIFNLDKRIGDKQNASDKDRH